MKIVHFTDTHIIESDDLLRELSPNLRLSKLVSHINKHHEDADLCVITGDLTHRGLAEQYEQFDRIMAELDIPYFLGIGNHDKRDIFQEYFPEVPVDPNGFVQYTVEMAAGTLIVLDTNDPGKNAGVLCEERLEWLAEELEASEDTPVFLAMHHPPFDTYLKPLDRMRLVNNEEFWDVIEPHADNIRHIFMGHVHRTISGKWRGISYSMLKGTNHQVALDFTSERFIFTKESAEYSITLVDPDNVLTFNKSIKT